VYETAGLTHLVSFCSCTKMLAQMLERVLAILSRISLSSSMEVKLTVLRVK
jgi:hypothetical protein